MPQEDEDARLGPDNRSASRSNGERLFPFNVLLASSLFDALKAVNSARCSRCDATRRDAATRRGATR